MLFILLVLAAAAPKTQVTATNTANVTATVTSEPSPSTASTPTSSGDTTSTTDSAVATTTQASTTAAVQDDHADRTKLSMAFGELGSFNVEGLSRSATVWIVVIGVGVIVLAIAIGAQGSREGGGNGFPAKMAIGFGLLAALALMLILRWKLRPFNDIETFARTAQFGLRNVTDARDYQMRRAAKLEADLARANARLQAQPALEAKLVMEEEQLKRRERDLNARLRERGLLIAQIRSTQGKLHERENELRRINNQSLLIMSATAVLLIAILGGYFILFIRYRTHGFRDGHFLEREYERMRVSMEREIALQTRSRAPAPTPAKIYVKGRHGELETHGVEWTQEYLERFARDLNDLG